MTIHFTATATIVNGHKVESSKTEKKQLAIMLKRRLGLV